MCCMQGPWYKERNPLWMCPLWCWSPRSTLFLTMLQSKHFLNITVLAKLIWFTKIYFFLLCYMLFVTIFSCKYEVNVLVVEVTLTNRPLGYLEDDVRFLALHATCWFTAQISWRFMLNMKILWIRNSSSVVSVHLWCLRTWTDAKIFHVNAGAKCITYLSKRNAAV